MEEHNHQNQETAPIIPAPEGIYNVSNETAMNIERAELVLSYIINQGIDISEDLVKTVVDSKFMSRQKKWNPEIEVKFRMAYKELTKIIKPVTVDSLISSRPKPLSGNGAFEKMLSFVGKKER
ncbi:MAG: hypothetical protein VZQ51_00355, partial [Bacteroidales bacterium]|nr:hypothetical protein [Bacteroidales bacterium]